MPAASAGFLIVADICVIDDVHPPIVFGLAVDDAAAFNGNVLQILTQQQRVCGEIGFRFGSKKRGADFQIKLHVAAQVQSSGSVIARWQVNFSAS